MLPANSKYVNFDDYSPCYPWANSTENIHQHRNYSMTMENMIVLYYRIVPCRVNWAMKQTGYELHQAQGLVYNKNIVKKGILYISFELPPF